MNFLGKDLNKRLWKKEKGIRNQGVGKIKKQMGLRIKELKQQQDHK